MSDRTFGLGSYASKWIQNCRKNGLSARAKGDVEQSVKDLLVFRRLVRLENLFLHECNSHYVLSTSEVNLFC